MKELAVANSFIQESHRTIIGIAGLLREALFVMAGNMLENVESKGTAYLLANDNKERGHEIPKLVYHPVSRYACVGDSAS